MTVNCACTTNGYALHILDDLKLGLGFNADAENKMINVLLNMKIRKKKTLNLWSTVKLFICRCHNSSFMTRG